MKPTASLLVAALLVGDADLLRAADDQTIQARAREAPSPVWPILGVAIAGAGAYLNYQASMRAADGDERCLDIETGCYWTLVGAPWLGFMGGAMVAYYGWRLGEHHAWRDQRVGGEMKDTRAIAVGGLVIGGAMVVANFVMSQYVVWKLFSCERTTFEGVNACFGDGLESIAVVQLATNAVLLGTAPFVGYGFAYDSYRERYGGLRARLAPALLPGGGGLMLRGTF